ncbi:hypothetical protein [Kiloniella sp.]|uniref:hypothetical protein n=1 Tax=Kiloniella sp. TaxID=1938587 RepID=UPI003B0274C8
MALVNLTRKEIDALLGLIDLGNTLVFSGSENEKFNLEVETASGAIEKLTRALGQSSRRSGF